MLSMSFFSSFPDQVIAVPLHCMCWHAITIIKNFLLTLQRWKPILKKILFYVYCVCCYLSLLSSSYGMFVARAASSHTRVTQRSSIAYSSVQTASGWCPPAVTPLLKYVTSHTCIAQCTVYTIPAQLQLYCGAV
jgi:hypothetical protein